MFDRIFPNDHILNRRSIGQHIIVKSSQPAKCECGRQTYWRNTEDMTPICSNDCLAYHYRQKKQQHVFRDPAYVAIQHGVNP